MSAPTKSSKTGRYRHHDELSALPNCPAAVSGNFSGLAYRAVYGASPSAESFMPYALKHPDLYAAAAEGVRCKHWSLSMYEKKASLHDMIARMTKASKNYRQLVGDHCATLKLSAADGRRTAASHSGHFSFYEFDSWDSKAAVQLVEPLPDEESP